MMRAGNPWSIERSAPLTFSASSARSLPNCVRVSDTRRNAPLGCSDSTSSSLAPAAPTSAAKLASGTPVQRCVVVQPSTQAIGSVSVRCSSASRSARLSRSSRSPERSDEPVAVPGHRRRDARHARRSC